MLRRKLRAGNPRAGAPHKIDVAKMYSPQIQRGECNNVAVRQRPPVATAARLEMESRWPLGVKIGGGFDFDAKNVISDPCAQIEIVRMNDADLRAQLLQNACHQILASATDSRTH